MVVTIRITGLNELKSKLNAIDVKDISKRIITKAAIEGENIGKIRSPVDTGRLQSSITHRVDTATRAMYGTFVPYGEYLDQPRSRNPHYRGGPFEGSPTAGWLSDSVDLVAKKVENDIIPDEVRRIESKW